MIVCEMQSLQRPLSASLLMGDQGSARTVQALNELSNSAGGMVYSEAGIQHMHMVQASIDQVVSKLMTAQDMLRSVTDYKPITTPEQLCYVQEPMQLPILCMPEIREMHQAGQIFGFGIPPEAVPEEDVYGRLINNGKVEVLGLKEHPGDIYQEWTFKTDDPDISWSDLDNIQSTRDFVREFLAKQKAEGGNMIDPTDYPNSFNVTIK